MFYSNRAIKKTEARNWEYSIIHSINTEEYQEKIKKFTESFNPKLHAILVDIIFEFPKNILITKENTLSAKCFDLSNIEKPLIDVLFLEKYSTTTISNLKIDDKYIIKLTSTKKVGNSHAIYFSVELLNLESHLNIELL
jgi:hypothetical protein